VICIDGGVTLSAAIVFTVGDVLSGNG